VVEAIPQDQSDGTSRANAGEWQRVLDRLKREVGEAVFQRWLSSMAVERIDDGAAVVSLPTRFLKDWVESHYADRLLALWRSENRRITGLSLIVSAAGAARCETPKEAPKVDPEPSGVVVEPTAASEIGEDRGQLSAPLDPRFTFEDFVVGKPNELAHAAARRVAEACLGPARAVPFNPLFLYGGVGLGKTHLMHAVAWYVRNHAPRRRVIYLSAEKFMYLFVRALRFKSTMDFKEQFRSVDLLMIDDVQFIAGKESTQEELFHTFNALVDLNRQIVISADKSPSDLALQERMKSRLAWGLVADLHPTTYELRLGILQSKAENAAVRIPQKVLEFLAHKIVSNVRELEGALNRIVAQAQLVGRDVTVEGAQDLLRDLIRANERRVSIDEIQKRVAEHFGIRLAEMMSARRARAVARPRQVAMYLAKQLTSASLPGIGKKFGGRDHTTVMHAVKKIEELIAIDSALAEDVELLRRMLQT
jgi:chromosomal replication initiator protein